MIEALPLAADGYLAYEYIPVGPLKPLGLLIEPPLSFPRKVFPLNPFPARIPDSTIAKEATELLLEVSPAFLANHCLRTFVFGDLLGQAANLNYDLEILYLGSLLHDLGLTERFDGTESFEIDGANAAYAFLKEHGLPLEKAALVREAIALHLSLAAAQKQAEIALVRAGAGVDVIGRGIESISSQAVAQVVAAYPRLGFKKDLIQVCRSQAERKPTSTIAGLFQQGFADVVSTAPFDE